MAGKAQSGSSYMCHVKSALILAITSQRANKQIKKCQLGNVRLVIIPLDNKSFIAPSAFTEDRKEIGFNERTES